MNSASLSWRCRCSSCRFEFPMSMPPRYGHVLIMHLLAVEYSQRLSSNWGSLGLVVSTSTYSLWFIGERELQYLMKMRQIVLKPLGRGGILVFCCGSTYHSVWWDPLFVRERERDTHTHTQTHKVGNSRNSFQCPNHWSLHNECTHLLPVCKPSWHSYSVHWIIFAH
jgi:hypothetical protein